jgi:hypothetical protein
VIATFLTPINPATTTNHLSNPTPSSTEAPRNAANEQPKLMGMIIGIYLALLDWR